MPLYIDGEKMPEPLYNAITCSDEKVWSSNTGRSKSAHMNGTIVAIKKNRNLSFPPLTRSELSKLNDAVSSKSKAWHTVKLEDTSGNTIFSFTCYFGTPSWTVYSGAAKCRYFIGYKVDAIER